MTAEVSKENNVEHLQFSLIPFFSPQIQYIPCAEVGMVIPAVTKPKRNDSSIHKQKEMIPQFTAIPKQGVRGREGGGEGLGESIARQAL